MLFSTKLVPSIGIQGSMLTITGPETLEIYQTRPKSNQNNILTSDYRDVNKPEINLMSLYLGSQKCTLYNHIVRKSYNACIYLLGLTIQYILSIYCNCSVKHEIKLISITRFSITITTLFICQARVIQLCSRDQANQ